MVKGTTEGVGEKRTRNGPSAPRRTAPLLNSYVTYPIGHNIRLSNFGGMDAPLPSSFQLRDVDLDPCAHARSAGR